MKNLCITAALIAIATPGVGQAAGLPRNYVFAGGSSVREVAHLLDRPEIEGVQIVYDWRELEPEEGRYEFARIEQDLEQAARRGKRLWIQLQDRFFRPQDRLLPDYVLDEPQYGGGLARQLDSPGEGKVVASGWTAMQWNVAVRARFQALISALAERFDGRVEGLNLPETAFQLPEQAEEHFDCDGYFEAELENALFARRAFAQSLVVQYVNFFPCEWNNDHRYMERFFAAAVVNGIGLGGPDIVPYRQGQMRNSYPFFNQLHDELPIVAMAVQGATLTYTNSATGQQFTREEFVDFATDYLGVDIIFWAQEAPWFENGVTQ